MKLLFLVLARLKQSLTDFVKGRVLMLLVVRLPTTLLLSVVLCGEWSQGVVFDIYLQFTAAGKHV